MYLPSSSALSNLLRSLLDVMAHFRGLVPTESSVAIVGAGAAGLCTAYVFAEAGYNVRIYEATQQVGGTWVYSPIPSPTSSLYASLRCNIPKQGMAFSDHPFPAHVRSFPSHEDVLHYLRSYSERFQLSRYCTFKQTVKSIKKTEVRGIAMWKVITEEGLQDSFHAVIICNGHFSKPHYVTIPGSKVFLESRRNILHSNEYKTPLRFKNRRVLIVGSGPSGIDISVELSDFASSVFISHRRVKGSLFPVQTGRRPAEVAPVKFVTGSGDVHLTDGVILRDIEDILLCTGYEYNFPFLDDGTAGVSVSHDGHVVYGLVRHCFAAQDPTIAFVGLPWSVLPFPLFEDQAHFLVALYDIADRTKFTKMLEEEKTEREVAELKGIYYHRLGDEQWEYRRKLGDFAGRCSVRLSVIELVRDASAARKRDPAQYREREYHVLGSGPNQWRVTEDGFDITGRDDPGSPR